MASSVIINEKAQIEVTIALDYYKEISEELSDDLLTKFREATDAISKHPNLHPIIRGKYRKINLERFPYKIVFRLKDDELHIVAFSHHKRKQFYWKNR